MMAALVLLVLMGVLFAKPAHAATFSVNSTNHPGTGTCDATECTLKEAITEANTNGLSDTIQIASGLSGEIELSNSTPEAGGFTIENDTQEEDLRIKGLGARALAIDGNGQTRIFGIASGAKATIQGLTIKNGSSGAGSGIFNHGNLTLTNSTLSSNSASDAGGGIANRGTVMNTATLTVTNSTISGNSAPVGGGIINSSLGTLTVTNSTISGNSASTGGGGIVNEGGTLRVTNSTISDNSAPYGGGIFATDSNATLANTIVAGNSAPFGGPDAYGTFTSQGYNLIGNPSGSSGWIDSDLLDQDAFLGPLQNNGGPTHTHALLPGSPAINAIPKGTNDCGTTITTDQRGVKRPQGGECEIGSFEDASPKVKRVLPAQNATGIGPRANVSAFFSEAMRARSINTTTIKLYKAGTTTAIGVQVSYDAQKKKAILNPDANLLLGKTYKAVVTTGAEDLAGNRLDQNQTKAGNQPKVWRFTVRN